MGHKGKKNGRIFTSTRTRFFLVCMLLGVLCLGAGCQGLLTTVIILVRGTDTKAKYKFFKGQKVAVVCLSENMTDPRYDDVPRSLAKMIGMHLSENVRKIDIVPNADVNRWLDRHDNEIEDFQEFGKDMKADMVLVVYIDSFETASPLSPGSFQGRSSTSFTVYEVSSGMVKASESLPELVYPPNGRQMATDTKESVFRTKYINQVARRVSCYFHDFDHNQNLAMDAHAELGL